MPSRAENRSSPPVSRPRPGLPDRGLAAVPAGGGATSVAAGPLMSALPAAVATSVGGVGRQRSAAAVGLVDRRFRTHPHDRVASTHAVEPSMEATVPSGVPAPQAVRRSPGARMGGPARSTPVHTQASA